MKNRSAFYNLVKGEVFAAETVLGGDRAMEARCLETAYRCRCTTSSSKRYTKMRAGGIRIARRARRGHTGDVRSVCAILAAANDMPMKGKGVWKAASGPWRGIPQRLEDSTQRVD
jgi:hypothetical protein